ncbi:MAG: hypothetical protein HKN45_04755 [Flavobacteriales bacterium]|nr:hypothetical protein [Flavobacteriales bacterium]NNK81311.1 hypothetical protein [Flavobacteriales bacterium]
MFKNPLSIALCAILVCGVFHSCEEECTPVDVDDLNAIYLRFSTDGSPGSFDPFELDSIYYIRFQESFLDSFNFPVDTIELYQLGFYDEDYGLRLSRGFPQGLPSGPPYYSEYKYLFMSRGQSWQVRLQQIEINGGYLDDCTYETRNKSFVLNDDTIDATGSTAFIPVFKD